TGQSKAVEPRQVRVAKSEGSHQEPRRRGAAPGATVARANRAAARAGASPIVTGSQKLPLTVFKAGPWSGRAAFPVTALLSKHAPPANGGHTCLRCVLC